MSLFWSPSTRGFYDDEIHRAGKIPGDAVPVTPARRAELIEAQNSEAPVEIVANDGGNPVMSRNRTLTDAERRAEKRQALRDLVRSKIATIADGQQQIDDLRKGGTEADSRFDAIDQLNARAAQISEDIETAAGDGLVNLDVAESQRW